MRLELAEPLGADLLAADAVGLAAGEDVGQPRQLGLVGGDDHLAAEVEGNALGAAELLHGPLAFAAVVGLERAGLVVDARVEHAGVAARLVGGELRLLFEQCAALRPGNRSRKRWAVARPTMPPPMTMRSWVGMEAVGSRQLSRRQRQCTKRSSNALAADPHCRLPAARLAIPLVVRAALADVDHRRGVVGEGAGGDAGEEDAVVAGVDVRRSARIRGGRRRRRAPGRRGRSAWISRPANAGSPGSKPLPKCLSRCFWPSPTTLRTNGSPRGEPVGDVAALPHGDGDHRRLEPGLHHPTGEHAGGAVALRRR